MVNLSITSYNPELAKFLLEKIIEAYLKYDVDTKVKVTNYANAQINLRLFKTLRTNGAIRTKTSKRIKKKLIN